MMPPRTRARAVGTALAVLVVLGFTGELQAQVPSAPALQRLPQLHTYRLARRDPWKALGWELLAPGAGNVYTGVYVNAAISAVASLAGAALWVHGAVAERDTTLWTGVTLFGAGRVHGLVSAPLDAALVNRALRRQLRLEASLTGLRLNF